MLKLVQSFFSLDIAWIHYFCGQRPFHIFKMLFKKDRKNANVSFQLAKYVAKILRSFRDRLRKKNTGNKNPEILIFIDSLNNWRALASIKEKLENSAFWVDGSMASGIFFPADLARIVGFLSLPLILFHYLQKKTYPHKWTLKYGLCGYLDAYGYFLIGSIFLKKIGPKLLIVGNDHEPQPRALLKAANGLGIETVYIQHAPVTKYFPPLEVDYALLDGIISMERYTKINHQCRIFFVGMSRRPPTPKVSPLELSQKNSFNVGLVFNHLDEWQDIAKLIAEVKADQRFKVYIRPHPADWTRRKDFIQLAKTERLEYSESKEESPWKFLSHLDFVVGGNSGLLLEAAFMGVIPLQYQALIKGYDHYGYSEEGISYRIQNFNEINLVLNQDSLLRAKIRSGLQRFDSTFDTPKDGKASEVASEVLKNILHARQTAFSDRNSPEKMPFEFIAV